MVVGLRIGMTNGTTELGVIPGRGMAVGTLVPLPFMFAAINGEIHAVVVEGSRRPGLFTVAILAGRWESRCRVVGVGRLVVFRLVAANAGRWRRGVVVSVFVAGAACDSRMRSIQGIHGTMVKSRWHPSRLAVTGFAIGRELRRNVVGVGRLVVIVDMTACAGVRRIVVIAFVARGAFVGDERVGAVERIVVAVNGKRSRRPGIGGMATGAIFWDRQGYVVGVGALVEIRGMAGCTFRRGTGKSRSMAFHAAGGFVGAGQRKLRAVVIKHIGGAACRVAGQASGTVVRVSVYACVLIVRLRIGVASGASEFRVIGRVGMAIGALVPFTLVRPAVNGEILPVMVKRSRRPGRFAVATLAIGGEFRRRMVRIGGLVVIRRMTARTSIRRVGIVAVMAGVAILGNRGVRAIQRIKTIVVECRRHPGSLIVAALAIGREFRRRVVRIGRLVVIRRMTARTGVRRVGVIAFMAGGALVGNGRMRTVERIIIVVDGKTGGRPAGSRMTTCAIFRNAERDVVGIGRLVEIGRMATGAIRWRAGITRGMALGAIHGQVRAREGEIRFAVVKHIGRTATRMTRQASRAVVRIAVYAVVLVVGGGIGMATGTSELPKIGWIVVAIGALVPGSLVRAAIDREIRRIVLGEFCRHPVQIRGVTFHAILGKM